MTMHTSLASPTLPMTQYLKNYRPSLFLIDTIDLTFELEEKVTTVTSRMRIRRHPDEQEGLKELVLHGEELTLISIKLNQQLLDPKDYEVTNNLLILRNIETEVELEIINQLYPEKNTALSGLYLSQGKYCTQCEAEGFRRITYFIDQPDILSRFSTTIIANRQRYPYLLSNGNLISSEMIDEHRQCVKWEDPFKKPSYLFALVAGDFDVVRDDFKTQSGRDIDLAVYVEKGYADQAQHALFSLKAAMAWDEKAFGREYDLDTYMIVAIHDFNMGAMENKGLNIFNTKYVLAKQETATDEDYIHILSVIGHEYFHNWSGNRVTCRDWFQLSLKEGLTIFRDQSFSQDSISPAVMRIRDVIDLRESQFPEDAGPLAHPVRPESYIEINNFYTATIYNKGAEVLRMIQTLLGKIIFRKGMDLYFSRYDGQAVTIEDFIRTMENVSGVDLTQFRLWYAQAGTPHVKVQENYNETKHSYQLNFQQTFSPSPGQAVKQPFHIPIRMALLDQHGDAIPLHYENEKVESEKILSLTSSDQTFTFQHIYQKPIASLCRYFSAPVILRTMHTQEEWLFLFKHDQDPFNRYEAGQRYMMNVILALIADYQQKKALSFPQAWTEAFEFILEHSIDDPFLTAEMITLPSENYIGEQMSVVDVVAIHTVREYLHAEIAAGLAPHLLAIYHRYSAAMTENIFSANEIGKRQLKNRCLFYLMYLPQYVDLAVQQFASSLAINMTNTQAALMNLVHLDHPERSNLLAQFYKTFQQDALVVDKWLAMQAVSRLPNTLHEVKRLCQHPAFDLKNPNKVYALIGSFTNRNPIHFHAKTGEGYVFLREIVTQLDRLNPQIAARMVKPLTAWNRYDKERQAFMKRELSMLRNVQGLSNDVYELVEKSLATVIAK